MAEQIIAFPEVVERIQLRTGEENLHLKIVGRTDRDITRMAEGLDELELEITDENLIRAEHANPIDLAALEESR